MFEMAELNQIEVPFPRFSFSKLPLRTSKEGLRDASEKLQDVSGAFWKVPGMFLWDQREV